MRAIAILVLAAAPLAAPPAFAAADPEAGRALASAWCSGCHAVERAGADLAPPLGTIARRAGRSEGYLFGWLSDPHPPMPQLNLSRQEIADIIAYLQGLRTP